MLDEDLLRDEIVEGLAADRIGDGVAARELEREGFDVGAEDHVAPDDGHDAVHLTDRLGQGRGGEQEDGAERENEAVRGHRQGVLGGG